MILRRTAEDRLSIAGSTGPLTTVTETPSKIINFDTRGGSVLRSGKRTAERQCTMSCHLADYSGADDSDARLLKLNKVVGTKHSIGLDRLRQDAACRNTLFWAGLRPPFLWTMKGLISGTEEEQITRLVTSNHTANRTAMVYKTTPLFAPSKRVAKCISLSPDQKVIKPLSSDKYYCVRFIFVDTEDATQKAQAKQLADLEEECNKLRLKLLVFVKSRSDGRLDWCYYLDPDLRYSNFHPATFEPWFLCAYDSLTNASLAVRCFKDWLDKQSKVRVVSGSGANKENIAPNYFVEVFCVSDSEL